MHSALSQLLLRLLGQFEILHRHIAALVALEVLQRIHRPLGPLLAATHDVDSGIDSVSHRLRIGHALARNVQGGTPPTGMEGGNLLGAGKIDLVGDTIERLFQNASTYNVGAAMSLVMMILIIISVAIMNKFSDDEGGMVP